MSSPQAPTAQPTRSVQFTLPFVDALADLVGGRGKALTFLGRNARHVKVVPVEPGDLEICSDVEVAI